MQCKANIFNRLQENITAHMALPQTGEGESLLGKHTRGSHGTCCRITSDAKPAPHHCHGQAQLQPTLSLGARSACTSHEFGPWVGSSSKPTNSSPTWITKWLEPAQLKSSSTLLAMLKYNLSHQPPQNRRDSLVCSKSTGRFSPGRHTPVA